MKSASEMINHIDEQASSINDRVMIYIDTTIEAEFLRTLKQTITVELNAFGDKHYRLIVYALTKLGYHCKISSHRNESYLTVSCNPL